MESIEKYQSELGEKSTKIVFENFYNLKLRKVPLKKGKSTPDYEIINPEGTIVAVCEVKSLIDVIEPVNLNEEVDFEKLAEKSIVRDRNHRSKLRKHHGKALSQLVDYKDIPKLIIFVSFDMTDYINMGQILQEFQELYPESPMADLYVLMKVHQGIIPSDKFEIKETIRRMYTNDIGKLFGDTFLSLDEALKKAGALPITFNLT